MNRNRKVAVSLPNYSKKTATAIVFDTIKERVCLSCGRDISQQHPKSKYCAARFVGYEAAAHQFSDSASNPRNNRNRKIEQITQSGVMFNIEPYRKNSA
jgi:hypothetical protein